MPIADSLGIKICKCLCGHGLLGSQTVVPCACGQVRHHHFTTHCCAIQPPLTLMPSWLVTNPKYSTDQFFGWQEALCTERDKSAGGETRANILNICMSFGSNVVDITNAALPVLRCSHVEINNNNNIYFFITSPP